MIWHALDRRPYFVDVNIRGKKDSAKVQATLIAPFIRSSSSVGEHAERGLPSSALFALNALCYWLAIIRFDYIP